MSNSSEWMNIKIVAAYDGTGYSGWQRTGNAARPSIQAVLEAALEEIFSQRIKLVGSGRTDAGVHAYAQTANFKIRRKSGLADTLRNDLNARLPEDIRILSAERVPQEFHSRYDAISKTYEYRIDRRDPPSVFGRRYCHRETALNTGDMRKAAALLAGTHDFAAFSTPRNDGKPTVRTLFEVGIEENSNLLIMRFTGNGFLYHMVRIMAGTLIEIGRGERRPEEITGMLNSRERCDAGWMAPAQGLYLKEVQYEDI